MLSWRCLSEGKPRHLFKTDFFNKSAAYCTEFLFCLTQNYRDIVLSFSVSDTCSKLQLYCSNLQNCTLRCHEIASQKSLISACIESNFKQLRSSFIDNAFWRVPNRPRLVNYNSYSCYENLVIISIYRVWFPYVLRATLLPIHNDHKWLRINRFINGWCIWKPWTCALEWRIACHSPSKADVHINCVWRRLFHEEGETFVETEYTEQCIM